MCIRDSQSAVKSALETQPDLPLSKQAEIGSFAAVERCGMCLYKSCMPLGSVVPMGSVAPIGLSDATLIRDGCAEVDE